MRRYILLAGVSCGFLFNLTPSFAQSNRIAGPIDDTQPIVLLNTSPAAAQPSDDLGPLDPATVIHSITVRLKPSARQQDALSQLLSAQLDPLSPDYHRWLSPFQFADRFGASPADLAALTSWLAAQGFTLTYQANARNWLAFSGTAAQVSRTFKTPIHAFQSGGRMHFANTLDVSIPAALVGIVAGVRGLDDFLPQPAHRAARSVRPDFTVPSGSHYLAPGDVATIYDIASLYSNGIDGAGQSIVVAGQTDVYLSDVSDFRSVVGLPSNLPQTILFGSDPGVSPNDLIEADLDLEWSGAAAPNATIKYVYSSDVFNSVFYAIDQWPILAPVISLSYGACELDNRGISAELRSAAQQANAAGITWIASSGDTGAAACDSQSSSRATMGLSVNLPASVPEVTAIGGTEFNENGGTYWNSSNGSNLASVLNYIPEIAWNDTVQAGSLSASGGGVSVFYPTPAWQTGAGFPNDGFRDVPDIAFSASAQHDAYIFCTGGECARGRLGLVGGTSAGTPVFAGIVALLNQYLTSTGSIAQPGLGNINPDLYRMAQSVPLAFHDIVTGSNIVPCALGTLNCSTGSYGYSAGTGYDRVTGLGSVDAFNLITTWAASVLPGQSPAVLTSPASAITGDSATLSGSVNPNGLDTQYWFLYSTSSSLANAISTPPEDVGAGTSSVSVGDGLTALAGNTAYFYQIQASNSMGATQGAILNFTTSATAPQSTLYLSVSPVSSGVAQPPTGQQFPYGTPVSISAAANSGWTFAGWTGSVANPRAPATSVVVTNVESVTANFIPQQFSDVTSSSPYFDAVNLLNAKGITNGCGAGAYCPDSAVTRAEMAIFIVRSVYGGDTFTLNRQDPYFTDVPPGTFGYQWIQKMFELGITMGCAPAIYCPNDSVSRAQMAAFIIRMRYAGESFTYSPNPAFTDVPASFQFFTYVQRMAADRITSGCAAGLYCPDDSVNRGEMAIFLMRGAFNWLLPPNSPDIVSVSPQQLNCCSALTFTITGANTNFVQGVTTLVTLPGITWSNLIVLGPTSFSVVLQGSATRPEPVYVRTGTQEEVLPNGLIPAGS